MSLKKPSILVRHSEMLSRQRQWAYDMKGPKDCIQGSSQLIRIWTSSHNKNMFGGYGQMYEVCGVVPNRVLM